ncbi:synaptotagmin-10-like [Neocloeon triangulifer]|uniref:synaptotagmin-10-like n=1 Tax=Neocloeon triangulifer TaxID=2078957 RepID=UPI00286F7D98|nr:synaptotagmin-10-like [Neocloeon triangulifer]
MGKVLLPDSAVSVLGAVAVLLVAAVSYQCALATWRKLLRGWRLGSDSGVEAEAAPTAVRISHSLPDLQPLPPPTAPAPVLVPRTPRPCEVKKVLRQTTLPSVPTRHQTFQRQLSHRLDLDDVPFTVCTLEPKHSLGHIMPELYTKEMILQTAIEEVDNVQTCGTLSFSLRYDKDVEGLVVKILEAHDLPIKDFTGSSDPYVKVQLLPDRKRKFQTKVHRKNLNPVFNETFIFSVAFEELAERYLQFSVYDFDRFSRHDLMGQVVFRGLVDQSDLEKEIEFTMNIISTPQEKKALGELMLSLCYLPTAGRLTVTVIKARNLKAMDITGSSDPYVKVSLICQGRRIKKRKTSVKKANLNPVYNEALVFDVPSENVDDVSLLIKVLDYDRVGSNELLGCAGIGAQIAGLGREHWLQMLDSPRRPVAQWHPLKESPPPPLHLASSSSPPISFNCLNTR